MLYVWHVVIVEIGFENGLAQKYFLSDWLTEFLYVYSPNTFFFLNMITYNCIDVYVFYTKVIYQSDECISNDTNKDRGLVLRMG